MTGLDPDAVGRLIDEDIAEASRLVAAYFDPKLPFAADTFQTIGVSDPCSIGTDDLLAITFLNVTVGPRAARMLLNEWREDVSRHLARVSQDLDLWDATDEDLASAEALWKQLCQLPGVGKVTAGKLLARKRPRLIPILDSVVEGRLQAEPGRSWWTLRECLTAERRKAIDNLRPEPCDPRVTTLRLLHVAIWMRWSQGKAAKALREGG